MRIGGRIALHQLLRIIVAGSFDALPGCQKISGDTGIFDDQGVIRLGTKSGRRPVCASSQDALRRAARIAEDHKLVVTEMTLLNDPVKKVDLRLELGAHGAVFVVVSRCIILEGAVSEDQASIRAERR